MRSTADRISATRRRQSLGGTDRFPEDGILQFGAQGAPDHEINAAAEHGFKAFLDIEELEEADWPVELDQHIYVAVRPGSIPSDRAKERQGANARRPQLFVMCGNDPKCFIPAHDLIICGAWTRGHRDVSRRAAMHGRKQFEAKACPNGWSTPRRLEFAPANNGFCQRPRRRAASTWMGSGKRDQRSLPWAARVSGGACRAPPSPGRRHPEPRANSSAHSPRRGDVTPKPRANSSAHPLRRGDVTPNHGPTHLRTPSPLQRRTDDGVSILISFPPRLPTSSRKCDRGNSEQLAFFLWRSATAHQPRDVPR